MEYPQEKNTFAMEDEFLLGKCNAFSPCSEFMCCCGVRSARLF